MKKTFYYALTGALLLAALMGCNREQPRIAIVDLNKVVSESNEGKKANAKLDEFVKAKQADVKEKSERIAKLRESVEKEPPATKKAREDELNRLVAEYQKLVASSESEIQKMAAELKTELGKQIKEILENLGDEEKYLVILTTDNAPYFQKTIDISDKVIQKYNES